MSLMQIYKKLPSGIKNTLRYGCSLIPLRYRLGKKFFEQLEFLEKSQWWSETELENYQNEQLRKVIRHAYENVPYYNKIFKNLGLTPNDIKTVNDLPKLPILTKEEVRNNLTLLRARNFRDSEVAKLSTSGTTGRYLLFYYDKKKEYLNFDPFIWRFFGWAGHKPGELRATFSDWMTSGTFYTFNPVRNLLIFSIYKMNLDNIEKYAQVLKRYQPKYLDAYPSIINLFTSYLKAMGINKPIELRAIFSHSECLYPWQRKSIEDFWSCNCFDWFGLEERVILGVECETHDGLHLCSDYGIAEFIPDKADNSKKIIATGLTNYAMPFIRYDTEDMGELNYKRCSCARGFPLLRLKGGRVRNFAIGKDNAYIPVDSIDIPNFTNNVWQFQFVQERKGAMLLKIVVKDTFVSNDLIHIQEELRKKFNGNMDVGIQCVSAVEQTSTGKTPLFIQKVSEEAKV